MTLLLVGQCSNNLLVCLSTIHANIFFTENTGIGCFKKTRQPDKINDNSDCQYLRNCPEVDVLHLSKTHYINMDLQTVPRTTKGKFCCMCKTRVLFLPFHRKFARTSRTYCLLQTQKHDRSTSFRRNVCCSVGHRHKQNKS